MIHTEDGQYLTSVAIETSNVNSGMVFVHRSAVKVMERSSYRWCWKKPGNYTFHVL